MLDKRSITEPHPQTNLTFSVFVKMWECKSSLLATSHLPWTPVPGLLQDSAEERLCVAVLAWPQTACAFTLTFVPEGDSGKGLILEEGACFIHYDLGS